jgi:hypothetical protein
LSISPQSCTFNLWTSTRNRNKKVIKVKLPDGTNYQMAPFQAGNNEDYATHIIAMKQLLEQKEIEDDNAKAFRLVVELTDEKLGSLLKKLCPRSTRRKRT